MTEPAFIDSPNNQGNINFEIFYKEVDEKEREMVQWSFNSDPDNDVINFLEDISSTHFRDNLVILDSGCGEGRGIKTVEDHIYNYQLKHTKIYGIDISKTAIDMAKKYLPNLNFSVQDVANLNFTDNMFDVIIDAGCLHCNHPMQHQKIMDQYYRVLKPGGILFFKSFFQPNEDVTEPIFYFDNITKKIPIYGQNLDSVKTLIKNFKIVKIINAEIHLIYLTK